MKKPSKKIFALALAACVCALSLSCSASGYSVYSEAAAFSDDIMFTAKIMGGRADYAYKRMKQEIADIDAQVSLTKENSDINRFNAAQADVAVEVGAHAYELYLLSAEYYTLTDGAFNCAVSPLCELWHVDAASIAQYRPQGDGTHISPPLPTPERVAEVASYCDPLSVSAAELDGKYYLTKSDARTKLDFGGIAKGYAVDRCAEILDEYGVTSALLDISGNAYFYGSHISGGKRDEWNIGVMSPRPRAGETYSRGYVCAISTGGDVSAVTSGDYMRYYIHDGDTPVYVPHIIGANGVPIGVEYADGEWKNTDEWVISATVVGQSSALCDALSTAVSSKGIEDGAELLKKVGCKGLIFTEKRYTIVGNVQLYKPEEYDGYEAYELYEP
ncbi:MAG: FAD:protein FMN transferase [Roseburia sp.]|nr:FAD:protein FMN transferase [Roseburia sp.]